MASATHKSEKKRVLEATTYLEAANILVVLPEGGSMNGSLHFQMPYNPTEAAITMTTMFHDWLMDLDNNVDALLGSGRLFEYEKKEGETNEIAYLNGSIAVWAFCLKKNLLGGCGILRFTSSDTFFNQITDNPEVGANLVGKNYQFVFLCDEYRFRDTGRQGNRQLLDFCAIRLVAKQVCIYPPLSLLYFLSDRHNLCDPPLSDLMLPSVIILVEKMFQQTATKVAQLLKEKYPD
jgi:hypothetical protein